MAMSKSNVNTSRLVVPKNKQINQTTTTTTTTTNKTKQNKTKQLAHLGSRSLSVPGPKSTSTT